MNILTITIPTYNRPEHIQRQVRSILPQLKEGVKLIVKDNCSPQPVSSLFTDEELDRFILIRNKTNIGGDANIASCFYEADSDWIWTLGDDDTISSNAIDCVLELIMEHNDCCYINMSSKRDELITSYDQLMEHLKIIGEFGNSFFMSACLFNLNKLKSSLGYYYEFLSSQVGQIMLVIKHMEKTKNEKCYFTNRHVIINVSEGGWSPLYLIGNTSLIFEKFDYNRSYYKQNLYVALCNMYFTILITNNSSIFKQWYYVKLVIYKAGLFNLLFRNTKLLCGYILVQLLPHTIFIKLRNIIASRYNRKISKVD